MIRLPSRLRRLDDALYDLSGDDAAMTLSGFDGFLTGIVVSPVPIAQTEWLPWVWGGGAAPYEDADDLRWFTAITAARLDEVVRDCARGRPKPIFDVEARSGAPLWDDWIHGFAAAMALRPDDWSELTAGDDPAVIDALAGMTSLIAIAAEQSELTSDEINALDDEAAGIIPRCIAILFRSRPDHGDVAPAGTSPVQIGRNDSCPCGSGRKHKRCCGSD